MNAEISYDESFSSTTSSFFILELPDELVSELSYKPLHIGGDPNQEAIISGSKSSYALRKCETSNSLLITDSNKIIKSANEIIKCEKIIPPLHQILELLSESPYTHLDSKKKRVYSYIEILQKVQASENEIQEYLKKIQAFELKGSLRILDEEYRIEVLKNFMLLLMEKNWNKVKVRLVSQELVDVPYEVLVAILNSVGSIEKDVFVGDKLKVLQICVWDLFLTSNEYFQEEFETALDKLADCVIYRKYYSRGFGLNEKIEGIAVTRTNNYRQTVRFLPVNRLSYILEERLHNLFEVKDKWSERELRTYLSDVSQIGIPQMLLKYTKKVIEGNSVLYINKLS